MYERIVAQFADQAGSFPRPERAWAVSNRPRARSPGRRGREQEWSARTVGKRFSTVQFSQDGRWLATTDYSSGDIQVRDLSTGKVTRVNAKSGDWTPAGSAPAERFRHAGVRALVVARWPADRVRVDGGWRVPERTEIPTELRVIARDGLTGPRTLIKNPEFEWPRPAAWSRDGRQVLAVLQKPDKTWQIAGSRQWMDASRSSSRSIGG